MLLVERDVGAATASDHCPFFFGSCPFGEENRIDVIGCEEEKEMKF